MSKIVQSGLRVLKTVSQNRVVRLMVNILVFGFCFYYLFTNIKNIAGELRNIRFNGYFLAAAFLLTWFVDWLGGLSWWLLLKGFGQNANFQDSQFIHFKSTITKYVPGFVWQYVGKIYLTAETGVPAAVTGRVLVWEFIQPVWTGLSVSLIFAPPDLLVGWGLQNWIPFFIHLLGGMLLLLWFVFVLTAPGIFSQKIFGQSAPSSFHLFLSAMVVTTGWLLLGVTLWFGTLAFGGDGINIPYAVFIFTVSMVIGILVIPVPNGLGIREGISTVLLGTFVPVPIAVLIASVSRLQLVIGEFACLLFAAIIRRISGQRGAKKPFSPKYF